MKVLFVSKSIDGAPSSFVESQGRSLMKFGITIEFFLVYQKGFSGYLATFPLLIKRVKEFKPDLIHAHYGLCGCLANLQRNIPVITTYHGSDINDPKVRVLSRISIRLSAFNIFVSAKQYEFVRPSKKFMVLPCGIDTGTFHAKDKNESRKKMNLPVDAFIVLFSNFFSMELKNAPLAIEAVRKIPGARLIELKGFTPEEVSLLMNSADVLLMTSFSEGAPLFIKEGLACGRPIVSTDVGDVKDLFKGLEGCFICTYNADEIAGMIIKAAKYRTIENARNVALKFDESVVASSIRKIYSEILKVNADE